MQTAVVTVWIISSLMGTLGVSLGENLHAAVAAISDASDKLVKELIVEASVNVN